ncbi:MAG TPA: hypothetical protein VH080_10715, partial [Gemmatimonadaceae bacterium]|nr:hypothetical protein [Gemmatimonadaceae bacterium]
PAHITELSPDSVRGFLPGFAYQCGVMIAGSVAYLEAVLAEHTTYANSMAITAATVFIGGAIVASVGRERRGMLFGVTSVPAAGEQIEPGIVQGSLLESRASVRRR